MRVLFLHGFANSLTVRSFRTTEVPPWLKEAMDHVHTLIDKEQKLRQRGQAQARIIQQAAEISRVLGRVVVLRADASCGTPGVGSLWRAGRRAGRGRGARSCMRAAWRVLEPGAPCLVFSHTVYSVAAAAQ